MRFSIARRVCALAIGSGALLVAGCGEQAEGTSQVVATVSGGEVTESQVTQVLEQQNALKPDQVEAASRKVVAELVDQEIIVQKARDLKLDRDQRVMQRMEQSKRDIVARAYLDRIADGAAKPSAKEVQAYYDENPALFAQRRIYAFQEFSIEATDAQRKQIEVQMADLKPGVDIEAFLKANQLKSTTSRSTLAPENIPLPVLRRVAALKTGQGLVLPAKGGLRILLLQGSQDSAVTEDQARPAIGAFLVNQHRRQSVERELAALRSASKVEYFGKYASLAASAAPAGSAASMSGTSRGASTTPGDALRVAEQH